MDGDKSDTDPEEAQADETAESMHNATEHLRRLWAQIDSSDQQKDAELSTPEAET
jgi:hypothetical protein